MRSFTQLRRGVLEGGRISPEKIAEVVAVVSSQLRLARELGAAEVLGVATAAVRRAVNGAELIAAIRDACGLEVVVLSEEQEARMAFIGAATTLGHCPTASSASSTSAEARRSSWSASLQTRSDGRRRLRSARETWRTVACAQIRPLEAELRDAHDRVKEALAGIEVPQPAEAVAVGGTATSLRLFAGAVLDSAAFGRSLRLLATERAAVIAARFGLDTERVRLLPAGLLILQGASELLGAPLQIGRGGLREGVLLEASRA